MAGKGFMLPWRPTTSSGNVEEVMTSWPQLVHGSLMLNHIFLRSSPTTVFDFAIVSPSGYEVFKRTGVSGEINEKPDLIMRGLYTLRITNAEVDGTYEGEFMFLDKKDK